MHADDDTGGGIGVFQFLADNAQADVVHPRAAVTGRDADAQEALGGHFGQQLGIKFLAAVEFLDAGRDLFGGKLARHFAHHFMFFVEQKTHR